MPPLIMAGKKASLVAPLIAAAKLGWFDARRSKANAVMLSPLKNQVAPGMSGAVAALGGGGRRDHHLEPGLAGEVDRVRARANRVARHRHRSAAARPDRHR